ncbi:hypothetical protein [Bradyrhizobium sp. AZCC 2289]|uniref:hypothetical protein n=1 Tax=Bradyrhizobium sp. AZCC 2289 TaxID=3117026 RepID=UPI002FF192DC
MIRPLMNVPSSAGIAGEKKLQGHLRLIALGKTGNDRVFERAMGSTIEDWLDLSIKYDRSGA